MSEEVSSRTRPSDRVRPAHDVCVVKKGPFLLIADSHVLPRPDHAWLLVQVPEGDNATVINMPRPVIDKDKDPLTVDVPREFHRRMAAIIDAVQTRIWEAGVHDLLGYATDYAFGQQRGLQTLVLKSKHRSAYVRLHWDTVMGDTDTDRQLVELAIKSAINELS